MKYKFYNNFKKYLAISTVFSLTIFTTNCVAYNPPVTSSEVSEVSLSSINNDKINTYITLKDSNTSVNGDGVLISENTIIISQGGTYYITGTLTNGQIQVNSESDVSIILDNANIACKNGPAIYSLNGDVTILSAENSINNLSDSSEYTNLDEDSEPNGCIFGKDRITIDGTGTLNITANYEDGIVSKDELKIKGSTINLTSVDDGIRGKDFVEINNTTINITSESDAIKSTKGYITVNNGNIQLTAGKKGFESSSEFTLNDGNIDILKSTEGVEATNVIINGGYINITSSDDGINASDGSGKDTRAFIKDPNAKIHERKDIENKNTENGIYKPIPPEISEDTSNNTAPKMLQNIPFDAPPAPPAFNNKTDDSTENNLSIEINGGYIFINAEGDGIDSNGIITFNEGVVIINGPVSNGDGALDSERGIFYNGGTVIAAGSSGMAEAPNNDSSEGYSLIYNGETIAAETLVSLTDENDNVILAFKPEKNISSVVFSSPNLKNGQTVKIYLDGKCTSELNNYGYYTSGTLENASLLETITLSSKTTSAGVKQSFGFGRQFKRNHENTDTSN